VEVERAAKVWVRALDYHGNPIEIVAEGDLLAVALQHEVDHLLGTVFVDHLSSLKRELIKKRMNKLKAERAAEVADEVRRAARHESAL
jgi:peptide deformylase